MSNKMTQTEIDLLFEQLDSQDFGHYDSDSYLSELEWDFDDSESIPPVLTCAHKWKKYVGLSQSFEYCTACDKKKGEE